MQDYDYKVMIFESWFDRRILKYKQSKDGKLCDSQILIKHNGFVRTFNKAYKRYMKNYTERNECFCDCIMICWLALTQFEISDDSTWEAIATGKDPKNYGKLMTYAKSLVMHEMERMHYKKIITSKTIQTEEGKKRFLVHYNIEPESLNKITNWKSEKEKIELINCFEKSFWEGEEDYQTSALVQWLETIPNDKLNKCLNEKQRKLLKDLLDANYSRFEKCKVEIEGLKKNQIPQRLKVIGNKLLRLYKKTSKEFEENFVLRSLRAELKVYDKITRIVECKEDDSITLEEEDARISAQILKSMNNPHFLKLIYDNLNPRYLHILIQIYKYSAIADDEGFQLFAEVSIYNQIIYDVLELVYARIDSLNQMIKEETKKQKNQPKKKLKSDLIQFPVDTNKKSVHLKINAFGVVVPKNE